MANVKLTTEKLLAIVQLTAIGKATTRDKARAVGVTDDTIREWEYRSNAGDPLFIIPWLGRDLQFAEALAIAQKFAYREMRARVERYVIHGRPRRTTYQGQFVPALDPVALAMTREEREALGFHPEAWKLDAKGAVVWNEEIEMAPAGLLERFLQTFDDLQTRSTQNINVNGQVNVGVGYVGKPDFKKGPPPIPPPPPVPLLEVLSDKEDDFADLLEPEPPDDAVVNINIAPVINIVEPEPAPRVDIPPPALAIDEPPRRPARTPLEQQLYDEVERMKARKARGNG